MSYLQNSTHYNNWIFTGEALKRIDRLRQLKARRALRLEHEASAAAAAGGKPGLKPTRKARSFAALVPPSSTATRDIYDWNDEIEVDLDKEEAEVPAGGEEPLSLDHERVVREFYETKIQESCTQLFRTSDKVKCCAVMLYKRFYLSNSVMEFHPKYIVPTAIYVAGKVEEQFLNVDTVAEQLQVDHKHIIGHEMILLEGVRFQLIMYHPFRSLLGFVDDFRGFRKAQNRELALDVLQKLHANSCVIVNELLLTQLPLLHYPAYIALASLYAVVEEMETDEASAVKTADISEYIQRSKFAQGKNVPKVQEEVTAILARYREIKRKQRAREEDPAKAEKHAKQVKKLYKRLKAFHDEDSGKSKEDKASGGSKRRGEDNDKKDKKKKHKKDKK